MPHSLYVSVKARNNDALAVSSTDDRSIGCSPSPLPVKEMTIYFRRDSLEITAGGTLSADLDGNPEFPST